jgi:monovalent cation:H+ antiporter-2, CPA2 family
LEDTHLVVDLVLVLAIALLGGMIARRLSQPVVLGYIMAGVLLGPNTPGFSVDRVQVEFLANVGVAFLMFGLGVEFSLGELMRVRRLALIGGGLQIPLTIVLGAVIALASGWSWQASILLGGCFAISSSVFALTFLIRRGDIDAPHGKATLGLMVVQDLALIPLIAVLPALSGDAENLPLRLLESLTIATVALALVVLLGTRLVPRVLYYAARTESRELFLITVVFIALGTALAADRAGLSLALGAFLAGLVVSESDFDREVLSEIAPLRDLFATLFFVAIGMLLVPGQIAEHLPFIILALAVLILGKTMITGGAFITAGASVRTALLSATVVAQMGEFSFVLAGEGMTQGIIDNDQYGQILSVAVASIVLTPFVAKAGSPAVLIVERFPLFRGRDSDVELIPDEALLLSNHVVICGYGRVGAVLGDALERRGFRYAVIELNPAIVRELRQQGRTAIYGDAGSDIVLRHAGVERARAVVVTTPDLVTAPAAVRHARRLNPGISIITRAIASKDVPMLRNAGANEIIQPEFEAGLESIRYVLREFGLSIKETTSIISRRRALQYEDADVESLANRLDQLGSESPTFPSGSDRA